MEGVCGFCIQQCRVAVRERVCVCVKAGRRKCKQFNTNPVGCIMKWKYSYEIKIYIERKSLPKLLFVFWQTFFVYFDSE